LAQILDVAREHIAVTSTHSIGVYKVFEIPDRLIQLAAIELALSPSSLKFLEILSNFVEMLSLVSI
jgi:hypothetical protein